MALLVREKEGLMAEPYNLTKLAADVTEIIQRERDPAKIVAATKPLREDGGEARRSVEAR